MILNCIIYTTEKNPEWFLDDISQIRRIIEQTKGVTLKTVTTKYVSPLHLFPIVYNGRFSWDWFADTFLPEENNVVVFHFDEKYRKDWGIDTEIRGTYRNDPDSLLQFWMACHKGEDAKNYPFSQFVRIFVHEMAHGFFRWTDPENNWKTHHYDYNLKSIDTVFTQIDFTRWNMMKLLVQKLEKLVNLLAKLRL